MSGQSATINVPADQPTIQGAIDAASLFDTVLVAPGTYNELIDIDKAIVVRSSSGAANTIISMPGVAVPILTIRLTDPNQAEFDGFTVTGGGDANTAEVSSKALVSHNIFHGNIVGITNNRTVLRVSAAATIEFNLFYNNGGINSIWSSAQVYIINNTIDENKRGIYSSNSAAVALNNIVTNSDGYGILGSFTELDYNCVWNNGSDNEPGPNGISVNPLYVNPIVGNYSLNPISPCVDAGNPHPDYYDIDGTRNDIGAFPLAGDLALPFATNINFGDEESLHLISHTPTIYWSFYDSAGTQAGYELEVGTDTDWAVAELWTTGQISSGDTSVVYDGAPLVDGTTYALRIRLSNGTAWGDWVGYTLRMNSMPAAPTADYPLGNPVISISGVYMRVTNGSDGDSDQLSYEYEIYSDIGLTTLEHTESGVVEQTDKTHTVDIAGLVIGQQYWWRARCTDGFESSAWTGTGTFTTRAIGVINVPAEIATIQEAIDIAGDLDTVLVAAGTYIENLRFNGQTVKVISSAGPEQTFLQPADPLISTVRFVAAEGIETCLSGFTIEEGGDAQTIYIDSGAVPTVENNVFRNNIPSGTVDPLTVIRVRTTATIRKNLFYRNGGINAIYSSAGAKLINNTIDDNLRGIYSSSPQTIAINNVVTNCLGYSLEGAYSIRQYNCTFGNGTNNDPGVGGIQADPQYLDPAARDYRLENSSPCVDAGHPDAQYNDPDGSRSDMGAFPLNGSFQLPIPAGISMGPEDKTHVLSHTPTIYWRFLDTEGSQTAYELEVGTDIDWGTAEMWATGQIISADTTVVYSGNTLENGVTYYLRARVNNGTIWGDWVDWKFHMNSEPTAPLAVTPVAGDSITQPNAILFVNNSVDNEEDSLKYDFQVFSDDALGNLVFVDAVVDEEISQTRSALVTGLIPDNMYWWRCRSNDGYEYSAWSTTEAFFLMGPRTIRVPSETATIQAAIDQSQGYDTILVADGIYTENIDYSGKLLVIISEAGPAYTFLRPANPGIETITINSGEALGTYFGGFTVENGGNVVTVTISNNSFPVLENNVFRNNIPGGVINPLTVIRASSKTEIRSNLFYDNGGINTVWASAATVVQNNTFDSNKRGLYCNDGTARVFNNIVSNSLEYAFAGTFAARSYNCSWNNGTDPTPGEGGIIANPLYIDPANGNYRLDLSSPCVDAGDPDPVYNDADGSRNDMGAYSLYGDLVPPAAINLNLGSEDRFHVISEQPTLYWTYLDPSGSQVAYEIEVGTDRDWAVAEMWATGAVTGTEYFALYDGLTLVEGESYYLRIRLYNGIGWGDWNDWTFTLNSAPTTPTALFPVGGEPTSLNGAWLIVQNSSDSENDDLVYDFEVYSDPGLTALVYSETDVAEQSSQTKSALLNTLSTDAFYYWRCRSFDSYEYSDWSVTESFELLFARTIRVPADEPTIQAGINAAADQDTVLVTAGTYTENLNYLGKTIVLTSEEGAEVTFIQPSNPNNPTITIKNGEGSGTCFSGFTVENGGDTYTVEIDGGSTPIIEDNIFRNNIPGGVINPLTVIKAFNTTEIRYNLFYDNGGINTIWAKDWTLVINNTLDGNTRGIYCDDGTATALNNIIANSTDFDFAGYFVRRDYNCTWQNGSTFGATANDVTSDPLFVDPQQHIYYLLPTSPCIDAGEPTAPYNDPDDTRNDMGAYPLAENLAPPFALNLNIANEDRLHVLSAAPIFNWSFYGLGGSQVKYQIEIGTDIDWTVAEMWSTGEVTSASDSAAYAGAPLVAGNAYQFRIRLNDGTDWGDWLNWSFRMNSPPSPPVAAWPTDSEPVSINASHLRVVNSSDAEGDSLTYEFEVYSDIGLTTLVFSETEVAEQTPMTYSSLLNSLPPEIEHWWRCRSHDGYVYSDWSLTESFILVPAQTIRVPADKPTIQSAIDYAADLDTVLVAAGTYIESINFDGKEIIVISESGPELTIIKPTFSLQNTIQINHGEGGDTYFGGFTVESGGNVVTLAIGAGATPVIEHNIFRYNIPGGIVNPLAVIRSLSSATIRYNLFYGNGGIATIYASGGTSIINNTFASNTRGVYCDDGTAILYNNLITRSYEYALAGTFAEKDYNCNWANGTDGDPGPNGMVMNPQYVDENIPDYHLLYYSPCVDAGHPDPQYNDADGSRNDIGAYSLFDGYVRPTASQLNVGAEERYHILSETPIFYWTFYEPGETQAAYEIEVGTDSDWGTAEMWQTSAVTGSDTSAIYAGNPLETGVDYFLRIRLNNGTTWGDWVPWSFRRNSAPGLPLMLAPVEGAEVSIVNVLLTVENAVDADSDELSYDYEVYEESGLINLFASITGVEAGVSTTTSPLVVGLAPSTSYWWRARSFDGFQYSEWTTADYFVAIPSVVINVPGDHATIQAGIDAAALADTVLVQPGYWIENIDFKGKAIVVLSAAGPDATTIAAELTNEPVVRIAGNEGLGTILSGFTITGSNFTGVHCNGSSPRIENNYITGNQSNSDNYGAGMIMWNTAGANIKHNRFYDNTADAYGAAISVGSSGTTSSNDTIAYNVMYHNIGYGDIRILGNIDNLVIHNNTISVTTYSGIAHQGSGPVIAKNNIIFFAPNYGMGPSSANIQATYNCMFSNGTHFSFSPGDGNIYQSAGFVDSAAANYELTGSSPCIDAGDPDPAFLDEDGTVGDIGAVSYCCGPHVSGINLGTENLQRVVASYPTIHWTFLYYYGPQTKYEVEIGTDKDWTTVEMWASGEVASADTSSLYAGDALTDGQSYYGRLRVYDDHYWSNWYPFAFKANSAPTVPTPSSPINGENVAQVPTLFVSNATDGDSDSIFIAYQLYADSALTQMLAFETGRAQTADSTGWPLQLTLDSGERYWWRVRATDTYENSAWSIQASFWYDYDNNPPTAPQLLSPYSPEGLIVHDMLPTFTWSQAIDPDTGDSVTYRLELAVDSLFSFKQIHSAIATNSFTLADSLNFATNYWWRVFAYDGRFGETPSTETGFFRTWQLGDVNGNQTVNISDLTYLVTYLFGVPSGPAPDPIFVGDVNGNCTVNISDITYLVTYLFGVPSGPPPNTGCELIPVTVEKFEGESRELVQ